MEFTENLERDKEAVPGIRSGFQRASEQFEIAINEIINSDVGLTFN